MLGGRPHLWRCRVSTEQVKQDSAPTVPSRCDLFFAVRVIAASLAALPSELPPPTFHVLGPPFLSDTLAILLILAEVVRPVRVVLLLGVERVHQRGLALLPDQR